MPYVQHSGCYTTVTPFSALVDWPSVGKHGCVLDQLQILPCYWGQKKHILLTLLFQLCSHFSLCISCLQIKEFKSMLLLCIAVIAQFYTQSMNTDMYFPGYTTPAFVMQTGYSSTHEFH